MTIGDITLLNIDCMEYMATVPDKFFELAIVDPPYGVGTFSRVSNSGSYKKPYEGNNVSYEFASDSKWNNNIPSELYFTELKRVSKRQIIWGANYYNCFSNLGGAVIWYKSPGLVSQQSQCEIASLSWKKQVDYIDMRKPNGFLAEIEYIHPCEKPINLYKWLLKNYAKEGDKIFDSHLGSGSIAIACHDYKFSLVGTELDKDYYDAACKRFKQHTTQLSFV
jgi:site-specific DNA-methyltransferase (adenine-specific)